MKLLTVIGLMAASLMVYQANQIIGKVIVVVNSTLGY